MAHIEKYEIPKQKISEGRKRHFLQYLVEGDDDPAPRPPRELKPLEKINGYAVKLDFERPRFYKESTYKPLLDKEALESWEQYERCTRLWRAVVLQALMDICYARSQKAKRNGIKYDAIDWIEGRGLDNQEARDFVLIFADLHIKRLMAGYGRIKENQYDLAATIGQMKWKYERDKKRADELVEYTGAAYKDPEKKKDHRGLASSIRMKNHGAHRPFSKDPELQHLKAELLAEMDADQRLFLGFDDDETA